MRERPAERLEEAEEIKPPCRFARPTAKKVPEVFRLPETERPEPIEEDALEIIPPCSVARPTVCNVPDADTFPLPPTAVSTKKSPCLNVLVLPPRIKEAFVIWVLDATGPAMPSAR